MDLPKTPAILIFFKELKENVYEEASEDVIAIFHQIENINKELKLLSKELNVNADIQYKN